MLNLLNGLGVVKKKQKYIYIDGIVCVFLQLSVVKLLNCSLLLLC